MRTLRIGKWVVELSTHKRTFPIQDYGAKVYVRPWGDGFDVWAELGVGDTEYGVCVTVEANDDP